MGPQNQDFRIQYDSLHRLFLLPRPNSSQTIVAISLDPPIRKGNTYYPFIICQFSNDEERTLELDISDEALKAKNDAVSPYTPTPPCCTCVSPLILPHSPPLLPLRP